MGVVNTLYRPKGSCQHAALGITGAKTKEFNHFRWSSFKALEIPTLKTKISERAIDVIFVYYLLRDIKLTFVITRVIFPIYR